MFRVAVVSGKCPAPLPGTGTQPHLVPQDVGQKSACALPPSHPERSAKPLLLGATTNSHHPNPRQSSGRDLNAGLSPRQSLRGPPAPPTSGKAQGQSGDQMALRTRRGFLQPNRKTAEKCEHAAESGQPALQMCPRGPRPGGPAEKAAPQPRNPRAGQRAPRPAPAPLTGGTCTPCP